MTTGDVLPVLAALLPSFQPEAQPEVLTGGYLNSVWRVRGRGRSVVVKHAPAQVGSLALDPSRVRFEADALRALAPGGALESVADAHTRAPFWLASSREQAVVVMEDVGDVPALDAWLSRAREEEAHARGQHLGRFVGRLHTVDPHLLRDRLTNITIQKTRMTVQYSTIGGALGAAAVPDAERLGARAEALGVELLQPGCCMLMGDLWPRSVLVLPQGLRVIDWEMVHVGQPWQDTAHLAAHLWMLHARVPDARSAALACARGFMSGYRETANRSMEGARACWHAGCEVVVRTIGGFQNGYLYESLGPDHPDVQRALRQALAWLRTDAPASPWAWAA